MEEQELKIQCDECINFPPPEHDNWKFGEHFKCLSGIPMRFKMPKDPRDYTWGFQVTKCARFTPTEAKGEQP